jgi:hypothetical protein
MIHYPGLPGINYLPRSQDTGRKGVLKKKGEILRVQMGRASKKGGKSYAE